MWVKSYSPKKFDWYLVVVDGKKFPALYNEANKFWCGQDGKTYKPLQIEQWLDDTNVPVEKKEWDNEARELYNGIRKGDTVVVKSLQGVSCGIGIVTGYGSDNGIFLYFESDCTNGGWDSKNCDIITKIEDKK